MVNAFDFHLRRLTAGTPTIRGLARCFSFSFRGLFQVPVVSFRRCIHFVKIHPGVKHPKESLSIDVNSIGDRLLGSYCHTAMTFSDVTPRKTNMEPENGPLEREIPFGNHHSQVPAVSFRGCICASSQCVNPFDGTVPLHRIP